MNDDSTTYPNWPRLLTQDQAARYTSMSVDTFRKICPVAPKDLGFRGLRWDRAKIDAWIEALPDRTRADGTEDHTESYVPTADERRRETIARIKCQATTRR